MKTSTLFRQSIENYKYLQKSISDHIATLPKGELRIYHRTKNGKAYAGFLYIDQKKKSHYIKNQPELISQIALKMFLEKELHWIEELIFAANAAETACNHLSVSSLLQEIPEELRTYISFDQWSNAVITTKKTANARLKKWKAEPWSGNEHYESKRKHRTSDGTLVKSKSELIIYELLLRHKIAFKYEAPLKIGDKTYYPDFTIMLHDGTFIYWEHAGLMNDAEYVSRHKRKLAAYESAGIAPWRNLIVTYDDEYGNLDIRIVESEIKNKLLDR